MDNSSTKVSIKNIAQIKTTKLTNDDLLNMTSGLPNNKKIEVSLYFRNAHSHTEGINIPDEDIHIHAKDFSYIGQLCKIKKFASFLD
jgi:hypothetical protein